ncbi:MAG TPA: LuxR C-terminal-related transcriptional regulator, partial [Thermoleophilaceae bacterium]
RLQRSIGRVEPDSPSGRLAAAFEARWAAVEGSAAEAAEAAKRALDHDGRIFAEQPELVAPGAVVLLLIIADELDAAQRGAERALAIARERSATPELVGAWWLNGAVAWARGDLAGAEADMRQALELARLGGILPAVFVFTGPLIEILIERGELEAAAAELEATGMASGPIPASIIFGLLRFNRGRLRLAQGNYTQAAEDLLEFLSQTERWGVGPGPMMLTALYGVRALVALGEREQARTLAEKMLAYARRWETATAMARAQRALGMTLEGSEGTALLAEAVTSLEGSPARLERAHALSELGAALRRDNRRAQARAPLREALELARRCGAAPLAKHVHEELRASGEKVRRYTPIGAESLTPSERRVAEMAASGMTNRQIAQTLFLTIKTIETHLSAAYDKLGIHSRRELADALGE